MTDGTRRARDARTFSDGPANAKLKLGRSRRPLTSVVPPSYQRLVSRQVW